MERASVLAELRTKVLRRLAILPGLLAGVLAGLALTAPLTRQARTPSSAPAPVAKPFDLERLAPEELEALALDVLTTLDEKRAPAEAGDAKGPWAPPEHNPRQVRQGMRNAARLLPLAKKFTLSSLAETLKTSRLSRERRLIASVRRVVLDRSLGGSAAVWENDSSAIYVGPDYAPYLTSDDEAMLMLGHELTHIAARAGRLNRFIERVSDTARRTAGLELRDDQKEELACEFVGAVVLRQYLAANPTAETSAERFSRAFGYEPRAERLARAWQDFCDSYNGSPVYREHLSFDETLRALLGLDPALKALIPDDAFSTRLCREVRR